jgi:adenosine deaminase
MIDRQFPFIDLHRHLEGSVRLETMLELAEEHG